LNLFIKFHNLEFSLTPVFHFKPKKFFDIIFSKSQS